MESIKQALAGIENEKEIQDLLLTRGLIRVLEQRKTTMTVKQIVEAFNAQSSNGITIEYDKAEELLSLAEQYSEVRIFGYDVYNNTVYVSSDNPLGMFSVVEAPDNGETKPPVYFNDPNDAERYALGVIDNYNYDDNATVTVYENDYEDGKINDSKTLHEYSYSYVLIDTYENEIIEYY